MALPITSTGSGTPRYWTASSYKRVQVGYKQAKPVDRVLAYRSECATRIATYGSPPYDVEDAAIMGSLGTVKTTTWNRCYANLKDAVSNRASLGVFVAEAGDSLSMIRDRALQLYKGFKAIRRGRFLEAAKTFSLNEIPKGVSKRKHWSNNVLEFQLGWRPLVGDMYNAIDSLQNPYRDVNVKGSALDWDSWFYHDPVTKYSNPSASCNQTAFLHSFTRRSAKNAVRMGCQVSVENPNLWLANQMGLVNPAVIAFELIPFSFVAGWFANFEQVLSAMTDWLGLSIRNAWNSQRQSGIFEYLYENVEIRCASCGPGCTYKYPVFRRDHFSARYTHVVRGTGLVNPTFVVPPVKMFGLSRSITAVALVTSLLSGGKTKSH